MDRVDIDGVVVALHHSGDEFGRSIWLFLIAEDSPHRPAITSGEPGHSWRVNVKFAQPADTWQSTAERLVDFTSVEMIAAVMARLMSGVATGTGDGKNHIHIAQRGAKQCDARLKPTSGLLYHVDNRAKYVNRN